MKQTKVKVDQQSLVFTDMDGTLLDHHDYSFDAVVPVLQTLKALSIPVIPNTSKTYEELLDLRALIKLDEYFIVENGAAIYLPKHLVTIDDADLKSKGEFYIKEFARPRSIYIEMLNKLPAKFNGKYKAFHQMSIEEVAKYTDLPVDAASKAQQRQYGEPIKWLGTEEEKHEFIESLISIGGNVVEGGRFIHFADKTDKASAMQWLADFIKRQQDSDVTCIALGDGNNDLGMLNAADISICIKSPINPRLQLSKTEHVYHTELEGPQGWAQSIQQILISPLGLN